MSTSQNQLSETPASVKYSSSNSRYTLHRQYSTGFPSSSYGLSPKSKADVRNTYNTANTNNVGRESSSNEDDQNNRWKSTKNSGEQTRRFHGARYTLQTNKEISSIDKINDPRSRSLVIAGKSHLGLYSFDEESHTIVNTHDFVQSTKNNTGLTKTSSSSSLRRSNNKISTISDVKAGFHNHKNYIAICGTSTTVSIYDINKTASIDNPLITTLSEHTRSINSVDFNMVQTNLIISGGQDGCIKVWDLRSPKMYSNRSDVSINTGSDSIRDVKWMPSYDFANDSNGISNKYLKFASVHDSGLLLKFDLRQPAQAERKINAHSGPGLCLNWHPHQDYIISGGRDGKCCLWYLGDKSNVAGNNSNTTINLSNTPHTFSTTYPIGLGTTSLAFPELTINTARPMNKLKFCPKYDSNVFNSLIGTSSMGEDSDISVYSLARKYIPKTVVTSGAPSVGFVWWDENIVFNIDKQNVVTGWDTSQTPQLLDNLPKNAVKWRDLDGDGILFLDQKPGGYRSQEELILTPGSGDNRRISLPHRMSSATTNSFMANNNLHMINNSNSSAASFSKNAPFGLSHPHPNSLYGEKPSLPKHTPSFSSKISPSVNGSSWPNPYNSSHHNSIASGSESALQVANESFVQSPYLIGLDFPHVLNTIRNTRLADMNRRVESQDVLELKSSPTEVFKFLARELKFSYKQSYIDFKDNTRELETSSTRGSIESKNNLMEKLGLTENNTWTHLIKYTKSHESDEVTSKGTEARSPLSENDNSLERSDTIHNAEIDKSDNLGDDINNNQLDTRDLVELITVCDKNAETYLMIEDFANYKVWLMMRDALLWDLKILTESMATEENTMGLGKKDLYTEQPWAKNDSFSSLKDIRNSAATSDYTSYSATDLSSSVNTHPRNSFNQPTHLTQPPTVSKLKEQLESSKETSTMSRADSIQNSLQEDIMRIRELHKNDSDKTDIAIEDYERNENEDENNENEGQFIKIPNSENRKSSFATSPTHATGSSDNSETGDEHIQPRRPRTSFIDSFISQLRSPASPKVEGDKESVSSKISPLPNLNTSAASFMNSKKNVIGQHKLQTAPGVESIPESSIGQHHFRGTSVSTTKAENQVSGITTLINETKKGYNTITPPWSTRKVIQQIYEQSVSSGNILLTMTIVLLFQDRFQLVNEETVKNAITEFTTLLHRYELFEIAAELMKNCPYSEISNNSAGLSSIQLYCDSCGKALINEVSKEKFTKEKHDTNVDAMARYGYWYCDSCSKRNTLCCYCNRPMKSLAICMLNCGHEGHFGCLKKWYLEENMDTCPLGCLGILL